MSARAKIASCSVAPQDQDSLDDLLGSATSSGTVFDGDWAQSHALAAEIMPNLFGDEDSLSDASAFDMTFDAFASCEADLLLKQAWRCGSRRHCCFQN